MFLNNKGFISTAAIYTIFVSFLMASILLLGMYSNGNEIYSTNNSDINEDEVIPLDKPLPGINEIIFTTSDNAIYNHQKTNLNVQIIAVAEGYDISHFEYSFTPNVTDSWITVDKDTSSNNSVPIIIDDNNINSIIYIRTVDFRNQKSDSLNGLIWIEKAITKYRSRTTERYLAYTYPIDRSGAIAYCDGSDEVISSYHVWQKDETYYPTYLEGSHIVTRVTCGGYSTRWEAWSNWTTVKCDSSKNSASYQCESKLCLADSPNGQCLEP